MVFDMSLLKQCSHEVPDWVQDYFCNGRYKRLDIIARGGFGYVFTALSEQQKVVIVKAARTDKSRNALRYLVNEARFLRELSGTSGVVQIIEFTDEALILNQAGPPLRKVYHLCEKDFNSNDLCFLFISMLRALRSVHEHGILHGDLKPSNFLYGLHSPKEILLADFGLSRRITDHKSYHEHWYGTKAFASRAIHMKETQGRKDELESACYLFAYFMGVSLPWRKSTYSKRKVWKKKDRWRPPRQLERMYSLIEDTHWNEEPKYDLLERIIFEEFPQIPDTPLSWEQFWR